GFLFFVDIFAQHLVHKTILSIIAWLLFGILLWGHRRYGWRGPIAVRWTLGGFIVLMLAYFGSKLVLELILQR
ncbi:MAG: cytochrome c biogenesis protein CcsA, partial [Candidatus Competibacteraceae bacterium]|nr:cytochrome c biogenesis protein CcsA [Candidatus Competibacteraceae bacterium]